jgi:pyruvate dehydrogenase (quinone)
MNGSLPGDVAARPIPHLTPAPVQLTTASAVVPPAGQITELARLLNDADKVMLFCGAGCRDAHDEVMQLADRLNAPVGHSLGGKE